MSGPLPGRDGATGPDLGIHPVPLPGAIRTAPLTSQVAGSAVIADGAGKHLPGLCAAATAATATGHLNAGSVVLVVIGLAVAWVVRLWWWPFGPCRRCDGSGKNLGSNEKRHGNCRKCKGSGRRQRIGSRRVHRIVGRGKS